MPSFFSKHLWLSAYAKRWWDVVNSVPMDMSCTVTYYTHLSFLTLTNLLLKILTIHCIETIQWWNIDILCRWVYLVPRYITRINPFLPIYSSNKRSKWLSVSNHTLMSVATLCSWSLLLHHNSLRHQSPFPCYSPSRRPPFVDIKKGERYWSDLLHTSRHTSRRLFSCGGA